VHAFEAVIPWSDAPSLITPLAALRERTGVAVQLAKMETSAEKRPHGSRFSHFVSYGFRRDELSLVDAFLARPGARGAVDAFVFRAGPEDRPWEEVSALSAAAQRRGVGVVVNVRLADDNPALYAADDAAVSRRVAEALAAAHAHEPVEVFLDTYVDLDRGYFPRHGLFDRRYNPRPASFVYRHLQGLLGRLVGPVAPGTPAALAGGTLYPLRGVDAAVALVLPREGTVAPAAAAAAMQGAAMRWVVDLQTGQPQALAEAGPIAAPALLR
jgi:hypothetical protein